MKYMIILMFIILELFSEEHKKILFISSYNFSFPTVHKQIHGITEIFDKEDYHLDIEFMDSKMLSPKVIEPLFHKILTTKKTLLSKYTGIIVGDDNALHFVEKYQKEFFDKKPIVFFAVNDKEYALEVIKNTKISGVLEEASSNETIRLIKSFHNKSNKIITLIDDTTTAKGILKSLDSNVLKELEFIDMKKYSFLELEKKLREIRENDPILFISAYIDKNLESKEFDEILNLIKVNTHSPIYHFFEHGIKHGIIGGKVIDFEEQGKKAAILLRDIFEKKQTNSILMSTDNVYKFNYDELVKYNLLNKVPKNSILINSPISFFDRPIIDIFSEIILLFSLIIIIISYLLYRFNKKSAELIKSYAEQSILLSLFDEGNNVLFKWKNNENWNVEYVSLNVNNLLGYEKEEFMNGNIVYSECIHEEDIKRVREEVSTLNNNYNNFLNHSPYRIKTKNKEEKWVLDYTVPIRNKQGDIEYFLGYILDITKEKTLLDMLKKLINLQKNIVFLIKDNKLTFANKTFYQFFECSNLNEFQNKYGSICKLFIKQDRFFSLDKVKENTSWAKEIENLSENERTIGLFDEYHEEHVFSVNCNHFEEGSYLVSFTDISEISTEKIKFEEKATHDKLTGAFNREYFEKTYIKVINDCKIEKQLFCLVFIDIDYFKNINDTYGHDVGDSVLIELVQTIEKHTRDSDLLFRWGGEEFILTLKINSENQAQIVLENLRKKIENYSFKDSINLTCSIGGTFYKENEKIELTIKRSDINLYEAKKTGRNKIIFTY